jgi:hypothetical protein
MTIKEQFIFLQLTERDMKELLRTSAPRNEIQLAVIRMKLANVRRQIEEDNEYPDNLEKLEQLEDALGILENQRTGS